jgi:hypothetical protein
MPILGKPSSAGRLMRSQRKTGPLCSSHLHKGPASVFVARIFLSARAATCPCCEGRNGLQTLSGCNEVFVERLLLFLLGCLLGCLLCLLRFLGHVALRDPKSLVQCKSTIDLHHSEYTTIAKLILRASKKVNDRHTVATFPNDAALARGVDTARHHDRRPLNHRCGDRVGNRDQCSAGTMRRAREGRVENHTISDLPGQGRSRGSLPTQPCRYGSHTVVHSRCFMGERTIRKATSQEKRSIHVQSGLGQCGHAA